MTSIDFGERNAQVCRDFAKREEKLNKTGPLPTQSGPLLFSSLIVSSPGSSPRSTNHLRHNLPNGLRLSFASDPVKRVTPLKSIGSPPLQRPSMGLETSLVAIEVAVSPDNAVVLVNRSGVCAPPLAVGNDDLGHARALNDVIVFPGGLN